MRLLLDTHALAWALSAPERLTAVVREVLLDASTMVYVSAVSAAPVSADPALTGLGATPLWTRAPS